MCLMALILLLTLADLASGYSVDDCPVNLTSDRYLQVFGDYCFNFVFNQKLNYFDAEKDCESRGGTLAIIKNLDIQTFLYNRLNSTYLNDHSAYEEVWIGLRDQAHEDHFTWEDGTPLGYSNWEDGERPYTWNNHPVDHCISMFTYTGEWKIHKCEEHTSSFLISPTTPPIEYKYICQHIVPNSPSAQGPVERCPAGVPKDKYLQVHDDSCFQFVFNEEKNYPDAESDCESRGGTLAIIKSQDTQTFLYYHLRITYQYDHASNEEVWIGLNDQMREDHFTWQDGTPVGYSNWGSGEGQQNYNTYNVEDCISMSSSTGKWKDHECKTHTEHVSFFSTSTTAVKYPYICQFQAMSVTTTTGTTVTAAPTITVAPTQTTMTTTPPVSITTTVMTQPPTLTTTTTITPAPTITTTATPPPTTTTTLLTTTCPPFQCSKDCGMSGYKGDPVTGCSLCECDF